jgi:CheY-like chemotaxis protein
MDTYNSSSGTSVRILVVDDHPNTANTLARAIAQLGPEMEVLSATSGAMALDLVKDGAVDVLITDMVMPGMNGLELIEKLQSHPGGRPAYIILVTAYDVPGLKESARRLKVNEIVIKPVRPERICQIIIRALKDLGHRATPQQIAIKPQLKILVADDLPDNVTLLARYLQNEGYVCITASDGIQALDKARAELPDMILLDVNMPEKDGFAALQEIRADPAIEHIPVIMLTAARLDSADMRAGLNLGADDYVTKPFDRQELLARIRTRLRVKEAEDVIRRRNKQLSVLPEIGRELSARLDIDELTDVVLRRTVETLGAMLGHLVLFYPDSMLHKKHLFSKSTIASSFAELPKLDALLEQIKDTRQGVSIEDTHSGGSLWRSSEDDPTHSVIVVPMFGRNDLLGLLILAHEQIGYFNLEHMLLLQAIASQAAIAVENAQLHANLTHDREQVAVVMQGAAQAAMTFDGQGRLEAIHAAGGSLFPGQDAVPGQPLIRGHGYDALIDQLEETIHRGEARIKEMQWPDGRTFAVLSTPLVQDGCSALLYDVAGSKNTPQE